MDRIRTAIDKARTERDALAPRSRREPDPVPSGPEATALEAWDALSVLEVNPKQLRRNRVMTQHAHPTATTFDVMRTSLIHEMREREWRRLAITSPTASCGKTTICLNLAFSLARQSDIRVMLIELDLRRPTMAETLGLEGVNFARVLSGEDAAPHHLRRYGDSLAIGVSQRTTNSAELLQGVTAAHQIDALEEQYQPDLILFDTPPMLPVDDTMAFIDQVDAALLVGAAEASTTKELSRSKQELETRTNLIGVVLNKCRYVSQEDGYSYGYGG